MAITTLTYNIDTASVTPGGEQFAGTQGDHKATELLFNISDSLYSKLTDTLPLNSKLMYRFEIYDGEGGLWSSDAVILNSKSIGITLEEFHTRYGGKITVYIVITALTDDGKTETELYSAPVVLRLANKPDGVFKSGESYESLTGLAQKSKFSAEFAKASADTAADKAEEAALSADKTKKLAADTEKTVKQALTDIKTKYVPIPDYQDGQAIKKVLAYDDSDYDGGYYDEDGNYIDKRISPSAFKPKNIDDGQDLEHGVNGKSNTSGRSGWLVSRDGKGNLWTGDPIDNEDCVNKKYITEVIEKCVPKKKIVDMGAPFDSVIAVNNGDYSLGDADGNGAELPNNSSYHYRRIDDLYSGKDIDMMSIYGGFIPVRDKAGNLCTGTPTDDSDCANKKYVSEAIEQALEPINDNFRGIGTELNTIYSNFTNYYTKTDIDEKLGDIEALLGGI